MNIQYVSNTCDIDGVISCGEIGLFYKDGTIVYHHDYSDGALELDSIESLLKPFGVDITFESIKPTKTQIKEINKYLNDNGYVGEEE